LLGFDAKVQSQSIRNRVLEAVLLKKEEEELEFAQKQVSENDRYSTRGYCICAIYDKLLSVIISMCEYAFLFFDTQVT